SDPRFLTSSPVTLNSAISSSSSPLATGALGNGFVGAGWSGVYTATVTNNVTPDWFGGGTTTYAFGTLSSALPSQFGGQTVAYSLNMPQGASNTQVVTFTVGSNTSGRAVVANTVNISRLTVYDGTNWNEKGSF